MQTVYHPSEKRGKADYGWLKTRYSFSFAEWYDKDRMGFGALRVLNDDWVAPHSGFPMHSHADMEIITIVTAGAVSHQDSMGNKKKVTAGEVQVMSAGTGVTHSEMNLEDEPLELFQIWITPREDGIAPRYDQKKFLPTDRKNKLQLIVSENGENGSLAINQDARLYLGELKAGKTETISLAHERGVYLLVIDGKVRVGEQTVSKRDAFGVWDVEQVPFIATEDSSLLFIELPMA